MLALLKVTGKAGGGCLVMIAIIVALLAVSGLWWGWLFMIIAGALGWHIGFGASYLVGLGLSCIIG